MLHNKIAVDSIIIEQVIQKIDFDGGAPTWVDFSASTHGGSQAHLKENKASKQKKILKKLALWKKFYNSYICLLKEKLGYKGKNPAVLEGKMPISRKVLAKKVGYKARKWGFF